jgi:hypothetical protein
MSIQYINIGSNANDGTGDDLRTAFLKVNDNFQLLATIGGETNVGANLGGGSGQVYASKTNETLNFRTIAGDVSSGITVNQSGNVITIASNFSVPASITTLISDDNSGQFTTTSPGATFRFNGTGGVTTSLNANILTIDGQFSLIQDPLPLLGGNLDLNGSNVSGLGDISIVGDITSDNLTVGRIVTPGVFPATATVNGSLTVRGSSSLQAVTATSILTNNIITAPGFTATSGAFTGNLTGNSTGTHYGNVALKVVDPLDPNYPEIVIVDSDTQTITGTHFGTFSGGMTGSLITGGLALDGNAITGQGRIEITGPLIPTSTMPFKVIGRFHGGDQADGVAAALSDGPVGATFSMVQQPNGFSEPIRLQTYSKNGSNSLPLGPGIRFESINEIDITDPLTYDPLNPPSQPEYVLHGHIGVLSHIDGVEGPNPAHSSFVARVRHDSTVGEMRDVIVARGNDRVSITGVDIDITKISTRIEELSPGVVGPKPYDLIITNESSGNYINFYGDYDPLLDDGAATGSGYTGYSFPKVIGAPGEVLTVQLGTNLLTWAIPGGGGGGGGTTLLNLTDVPDSYATHAGKLLRVKSTSDGIEFTNSFNATVTGSLIGNADTATALETARTINGFTFDGTQNITIDTRQIEELKQQASNASLVGSSGNLVTTTTITIAESNLTVNAGEPSTNQGARKFRVGMIVKGIDILDAVITNIALTGGSTPVPNNDRTVTLTITFDSQVVDAQTGLNITGEVTNQWFNDAKVRETISVSPGSALSYNETLGLFTLSDAVSSVNNTLVRRNGTGEVFLKTAYVTTLTKNSADSVITVTSPVSTNSEINSTANITTTGTVIAGFITLNGVGNQTIASSAGTSIILQPGTSVDVSGKKITNLSIAAPTADSDASTKKYVDDEITGLFNETFQELPVSGDTGGTLNVQRSAIFTVAGSSNIATATTGTGIQINLKSTISGISISGNLPVTGNVTSSGGFVKGGNVKIDGNAVTQTVTGSDLNLVPGDSGGSVVVSGSDLELVNSRLFLNGSDTMEFPPNTLEQSVTLVTATTFIRTANWVDDSAGLAYASLANGSPGQIKTIIMASRGTYGNALDTRPRYLLLSGNINGSTRTVNIAASDPNGSTTFLFLNNSWWRIAHVA